MSGTVRTTEDYVEGVEPVMGSYHDGWGRGGWLVMTLMMLAFWALVIFAVVMGIVGTR